MNRFYKKALAVLALLSCLALTGCSLKEKLSGSASGTKTISRPAVESAETQFAHPAAGDTVAVFDTSAGVFKAVLFPTLAPQACDNFLGLVQAGYYNGLTVTRVEQDFVVEAGQGTDGKGTTIWNGNRFSAETTDKLHHYSGALCAAADASGDCASVFYVMETLPGSSSVTQELIDQMNAAGWRADVGVRGAAYDNSEQTRYAVEPRAQLSYDFGRDNAVWLSGTINSQALVQFNRYYYSMPIDFWTPFRDGRLQHAWQVSLGGRAEAQEKLTLSVEGYYKRMRNLPLIYDSDDYLLGNGGFIYGTGRAFGIEAMLQYQTERLSLTASYTYTDSRRRSDGVTYPFEYDVPHDFNAFVSYDVVKRPGRKHTFSLNVAWRSGLPYRLTNESYPDTDGNPIIGITAYPTMRMHNYFRADVSYNMERCKRNGVRNWQFSIINATWHKNPVSIYPYRGSYKATVLIPIMPSVSYTRTFGK